MAQKIPSTSSTKNSGRKVNQKSSVAKKTSATTGAQKVEKTISQGGLSTEEEEFDYFDEEEEEEEIIEGPVKAIIIGAGRRSEVYSNYSLNNPEELKIVAVADLNQYRRERMALRHLIIFERIYLSYVCLPDKKVANLAIICTPENLRTEVIQFMASRGYALIIEKPLAKSYSECKNIIKILSDYDTYSAIAHVLRYDPHLYKMLEVIKSGVIGQVITIHHTNPIGWFHFAHSHVRDMWANTSKYSTLLCNKGCHDFEMLRALVPDSEVKSIYSSGTLAHFKESNKPPGAGMKCIGCSLEETCPYSASRIYLQKIRNGNKSWPINEVADFPDTDSVTNNLISGKYGKCVYEQLNDAVDNQDIIVIFDNGITATLSFSAFTSKVSIRQTIIRGSSGELTCNFDESFVQVYDFTREGNFLYHLQPIPPEVSSTTYVTARACDNEFIREFLEQFRARIPMLTSHWYILKTYLYLFAAEKSRVLGKIMNPLIEENILD